MDVEHKIGSSVINISEWNSNNNTKPLYNTFHCVIILDTSHFKDGS